MRKVSSACWVFWADLWAEKVTGIDIYPAQPSDCPENVVLECDDLNRPLTDVYDENHFDLIHSHFVAPGIHRRRWPSYVQDLVKILKPGGWVQMAELYYNIQSDSGMLTEEHALYQWGEKYRSAMERDRDPRVGNRLVELMRTARLGEVQSRYIPLPIGEWPTSKYSIFN